MRINFLYTWYVYILCRSHDLVLVDVGWGAGPGHFFLLYMYVRVYVLHRLLQSLFVRFPAIALVSESDRDLSE